MWKNHQEVIWDFLFLSFKIFENVEYNKTEWKFLLRNYKLKKLFQIKKIIQKTTDQTNDFVVFFSLTQHDIA